MAFSKTRVAGYPKSNPLIHHESFESFSFFWWFLMIFDGYAAMLFWDMCIYARFSGNPGFCSKSWAAILLHDVARRSGYLRVAKETPRTVGQFQYQILLCFPSENFRSNIRHVRTGRTLVFVRLAANSQEGQSYVCIYTFIFIDIHVYMYM